MPQVFKVGSYWVYFWSNENEPLEPIHVHVAQGSPSPNSAKIWITKSGQIILVKFVTFVNYKYHFPDVGKMVKTKTASFLRLLS